MPSPEILLLYEQVENKNIRLAIIIRKVYMAQYKLFSENNKTMQINFFKKYLKSFKHKSREYNYIKQSIERLEKSIV